MPSPTGASRREVSPAPAVAVVEDIVRRMLSELGEGNFRKRSLGVGKPEDGQVAGVHNAVWAQIKVDGGGAYDVPHALGVIPVLCEMKSIESAVGASVTPHAVSSPVRQAEWTATSCRVDIAQVGSGSLNNCIATFFVRGA